MHLLKIERLRNNPILKAIFIIILFAFIWTFSEYSYKGNNDIIATVGDKSITSREFAVFYDRYLRSMNPEMQKLAGDESFSKAVKNYVLSQLITQKYQDIFIERLGITMSDDMTAKEIRKSEAFQKNGVFNQEIFDQFLKRENKREKEFISDVKESILREYISSFLSQQVNPISRLVAKELYPFYYQQVFFDMIKISPAKNLSIASAEEIESFYKKNKNNYQTVPFRKVRMLDLSAMESKSIENIKEEVYAGDSVETIAKNSKLNVVNLDLFEDDSSLKLDGQSDDIAQALKNLVLKAEKNYSEIFYEEYGEKDKKKTAAFVFEVIEITPSREQSLDEAKVKVVADLEKEKELKTTTDAAYMLFSSLSDKRDYPFLTNVIFELSKDMQLNLNDDSVVNNKIPSEVKEKIIAAEDNKNITKIGDSFYLVNIYKRLMPQDINQDKLKYLELNSKNAFKNSLMQEIFNESKIEVKINNF
jgi:hypothetical protein